MREKALEKVTSAVALEDLEASLDRQRMQTNEVTLLDRSEDSSLDSEPKNMMPQTTENPHPTSTEPANPNHPTSIAMTLTAEGDTVLT